MLWSAIVRSPYAHARINGVDTSRGEGARRSRRRVHRRGARECRRAALSCAWPVTDDIKNPPHWPLAKDKARHVGDAVAVVVAESRALAKDALELVDVDWEPLPAVTDVKAALADGAPLVHDEFGTNDAGSWSIEGDSPAPRAGDEAVLRRPGPREDQGGVPPRAPDPERDRAARRGRRAERRDGRVHVSTRRPRSRTSCAPRSRSRAASPRPSCASSRPTSAAASARSSRSTPRRRSASRSRAKLGRPIKWIEERSRELRRHAPRPRRCIQEIELAATRDGDAEGGARRRCSPRWARTSGSSRPASRCSARGCTTAATSRRLRLRVHERLHEQDAHRRLPRRRPARGDLRDRARDGRPRARARHGPGRAAAQELHHDRQVPELHDRQRADGRLGRLRRHARQVPRGARLRRAARRAEGAPRARRHQAARGRLLDVDRDVRARAVAGARRAQVRRRRLGRGDDRVHADRHGAGADRRLAARAGPRDDVLRRSSPTSSASTSTTSRCCTGTRRSSPLGMDTYGSRGARGRRRRAAPRGREDHRQGAARSPPTSSSAPRRTSSSRAATSPSRARPRRYIKALAFAAWTAHDLPDGMEPGLEAHAPLRPAELLAGPTAPTPAWSRSTPRPARSTSCATSPSTTAASSSTRWSSRARCTAASRRASPRRSSRRRVYDEEATCSPGR